MDTLNLICMTLNKAGLTVMISVSNVPFELRNMAYKAAFFNLNRVICI